MSDIRMRELNPEKYYTLRNEEIQIQIQEGDRKIWIGSLEEEVKELLGDFLPTYTFIRGEKESKFKLTRDSMKNYFLETL